MRYFYERPFSFGVEHGRTYECNHPLYTKCTLYERETKGLAVIQKRFNPEMKLIWWGPIDPWLIDDIFEQDGFDKYFLENSGDCKDGIFPTVTVRSLMYALKMKPLHREFWEGKIR